MKFGDGVSASKNVSRGFWAGHQCGQKANATASISKTYETRLFHRNGSLNTRSANTVNTIKVMHSCMILSYVTLK
jgi:hypothetical protein